MTAQEIADLIDRLKGHFVLTAVGLTMAVNPEADRLLDESGVNLDRDQIRLRRSGKSDYTLPIREVVEASQLDKDRQWAVIESWLELSIIRVGAALDERKYFDKAPVLVFFKHVRNGLAHGNTFDRPTAEAEQRGNEGDQKRKRRRAGQDGYWALTARFGDRTITKKTEGRVYGGRGLLKRGDLLALLDEVAAHLRTDPPQLSHRDARAVYGSAPEIEEQTIGESTVLS
ncbi:hypothetical protein [Rhodococcus sp. Q]|uniref:hypothetical protein n=1 Tax=Rhodococcus sp. Q TaxID=2502252 RepID=UPI0020163FB4|nr:hypothetical protein [Rhodococcus sp. Q]